MIIIHYSNLKSYLARIEQTDATLTKDRLKKILKCSNYIDKWHSDHYRYGSSWFDVLLLKWKLRKLNKLLNKHSLSIRLG